MIAHVMKSNKKRLCISEKVNSESVIRVHTYYFIKK